MLRQCRKITAKLPQPSRNNFTLKKRISSTLKFLLESLHNAVSQPFSAPCKSCCTSEGDIWVFKSPTLPPTWPRACQGNAYLYPFFYKLNHLRCSLISSWLFKCNCYAAPSPSCTTEHLKIIHPLLFAHFSLCPRLFREWEVMCTMSVGS